VVTVPALVLGGAEDPWVKPAELRAVAAAMPGPARVEILAAGHGALLAQAPGEYRRVLQEWLAGAVGL
jgi:pimeloyl-ACP methyl ester carboxylesterase